MIWHRLFASLAFTTTGDVVRLKGRTTKKHTMHGTHVSSASTRRIAGMASACSLTRVKAAKPHQVEMIVEDDPDLLVSEDEKINTTQQSREPRTQMFLHLKRTSL